MVAGKLISRVLRYRAYRRPAAKAGGLTLVLLVATALSAPSSALASGLLGSGIGPNFGPNLNPLDAVGGAVKDAVTAVLELLFGAVPAHVSLAILRWLVELPDFTGGNVDKLEQLMQASAFGLLGLVMTVSVIRFWLAGISASGGFEAFQGLARTVGAALMIVAWPFAFRSLLRLVDILTHSLLSTQLVNKNASTLMGVAIGTDLVTSGSALGLFFKIIALICGALLLIGLFLFKIMLSASLLLIFVGMPLALVLWPIPELSWGAGVLARTMAVILTVPVIWVLTFALFSAVSVDALTFQGQGGFIDKALVKPLVGVAMMAMAILAPMKLLRAASLASAFGAPRGGGTASRLVSYTASRALYGAAAAHIPEQWGGHAPAGGQAQGTGGEGLRRTAAAVGATVATAGAGAPAALAGAAGGAGGAQTAAGNAAAATAASSSGHGVSAASSARAPAVPAAGGWGRLENAHKPGSEDHQRLGDYKTRAASNEASGTVDHQQARDAYRALSDAQQQRVAALMSSETHAGMRSALAEQAAFDGHSTEQRQAFMTLASASESTLSAGVGEARSAIGSESRSTIDMLDTSKGSGMADSAIFDTPGGEGGLGPPGAGGGSGARAAPAQPTAQPTQQRPPANEGPGPSVPPPRGQ